MSTKPLLCVTVTGRDMAELRRNRDAATGADLVELRLDTVSDPDVAGALAGRTCPVIVTCRPSWEGGHFSGAEDERRRLLRQACELGAEYVDVEWRARFDDVIAARRGRGIVLSMHDFDGVPADVAERARAMRASGAEVVKVAVRASRLRDCLTLLDLRSAPGNGDSVLIAMGECGLATRVLPQRFGSRWTYAGALSGIGQVTADSLLRDFRFRRLSHDPAVYGLAGSPIGHSVSPAMHNAALGAADMDGVYLPLPAADGDDFMAFANGFNLRGASVTIPFKVALSEQMNELSPSAREAGAVNTIVRIDGRWRGANTDTAGFLRPLEDRRVALDGLRASILGAGGSARAAAIGLVRGGASVTVHGRDESRAAKVASFAGARVGPWPPASGSWDLLVNCTPVGMHPHVDATPLPAALLSGRIVYDLVYNPAATELLRDATAAGCETIGGLDMLVAQAEAQFEMWTGAPPAAGVMRAAADIRLKEFARDEAHVA